MKSEKAYIFSLVAPLMIFLSIIGFISRKDSKKIFYLPIGLMGIFIISEKEFSRGLKRKKILNKIKSYKNSK
mgnify:CR=1 FL=1|tara:strand:+ start:516 stop:731 length:216 start_codon:yes stop_codon:yes gene_type:complete